MPDRLERILSGPSLVQQRWLPTEMAVQEIVAFERRFGQKHLQLACHAALPLIVSPGLVNLIALNFLEKEAIPWYAEAEFLLSPLCHQIDEDWYEVEPGVRDVLMVELERLYGWGRQLELADFLLTYQTKRPDWQQRAEMIRTHRWIALAYIDPNRAINEMNEFLEDRLSLEGQGDSNSSSYTQLATLLAIAEEPLEETSLKTEYQQLINGSQILSSILDGNGELTPSRLRTVISEQEISESENLVSSNFFTWMQNYVKSEALVDDRHISPTTLLIFVGYSDDAEREAQTVCALEQDLQQELNQVRMLYPFSQYESVKMLSWQEDEERIATPYLHRADMAIFIFKQRIGQVCWREVESCLDRNAQEQMPILSAFSSVPPGASAVPDREVLEQWLDVRQKRQQLEVHASASDSPSLVLVDSYDNPEHLQEMTREKCKPLLRYLVEQSFADGTAQLTESTTYDASVVHRYRAQLRDDVRRQFPDTLSDDEFLMQTGYLLNGHLTWAGVLLFTPQPNLILSSAVISCLRYPGQKMTDTHDSWKIVGPIFEQITQVCHLVESVNQVEILDEGAATDVTEPRYPMICLREILANALCHRDYRDQQRVTGLHIFSDRIEIWSPGHWRTGDSESTPHNMPLREFAGPSEKRNWRLVRGLAMTKMVESEGHGIASALKDCEAMGAQEPVMVEKDGFVIVTIYPAAREPMPTSRPSTMSIPYRRNSYFIGREQMLESLHDEVGTAKTVVLCGLSGVGKTQLAIEYAYRYANAYDVVWWIRAEEPETLTTDFVGLAATLNLSVTRSSSFFKLSPQAYFA